MATCSEFWGGVLKLLNFALGTLGLIMLGFGVYLLVKLNQTSGVDEDIPELFQLSLTLLAELSLPNNFVNKLPKTWFAYLLTGVGGVFFIISLLGYIGAVTKSRQCLSFVKGAGERYVIIHFYIILVVLLILVQLIGTAFILLDPHWTDVVRVDKTGYLHEVYRFLRHNWKAMKWVALGVVTLEALAFLVAFMVRALNAPPDEFESNMEGEWPEDRNHQLLTHNQQTDSFPDQENTSNQKPIRTDSWSQRMREKYGLDTSDFTYNPAAPTASVEETRQCNII